MTSENDKFSSIYLVRHGQTVGNTSGICLRPEENVLTEKGKIQASKLGEELSNIKFTRIYCSDYPRAAETANIAMEKIISKPVSAIQDPRLREIETYQGFGLHWTAKAGKIGVGMAEDNPFIQYSEFHVDGCEAVEDAIARQHSFFEELFSELDKSDTPETVLIVTHGFIARLIGKHMKLSNKYDLENWVPELATKNMGNCGYHQFLVSKNTSTENNSERRLLKFVQLHQDKHGDSQDTIS